MKERRFNFQYGGRRFGKTVKLVMDDNPELERILREAGDEILKQAREYGKAAFSFNHPEANRILIPPNAQINTSVFEEAEIIS